VNALRAVFLYEWKRSLTPGRIAWWFVMAAFPVAITLLILYVQSVGEEIPKEARDSVWSVLFYIMIPCVCTAMSVLLTAGPAVASELEQRSWVYLATRPNGIFWLLLGKYLVAFTWGFTAAAAGASIAVSVSNAESRGQILAAILGLSFLSALGYSSLFLLLGVIMPKRAMVFCVTYTVVVEAIFGAIPAIVNRITFQFRLRSLLVHWVPLNENVTSDPAMSYVVGQGSPVMHCFWLLALAVLFLVTAIVIAHRKEFTTAAEGDV